MPANPGQCDIFWFYFTTEKIVCVSRIGSYYYCMAHSVPGSNNPMYLRAGGRYACMSIYVQWCKYFPILITAILYLAKSIELRCSRPVFIESERVVRSRSFVQTRMSDGDRDVTRFSSYLILNVALPNAVEMPTRHPLSVALSAIALLSLHRWMSPNRMLFDTRQRQILCLSLSFLCFYIH